jgi:hypothetical protein
MKKSLNEVECVSGPMWSTSGDEPGSELKVPRPRSVLSANAAPFSGGVSDDGQSRKVAGES